VSRPVIWPAGFLVLGLLPAACRPADPAAREAQVEAALHAGRIGEARGLVARARPAAGSLEGASGWRIRLLAAEIEIEAEELPALRLARTDLGRALPPGLAGGELEARQQKVLGQIAHKLQELDQAERHLRQARALADRQHDRHLLVEIDLALGAVLHAAGRPGEAETIGKASAEAAAGLGDGRLRALALNLLGYIALAGTDYDQALVYLDPALGEARRAGAQAVVARVQLNRGICLGFLGQFDKGRALLGEAAVLRERLGLWIPLRNVLGSLGSSHLLRGQHREAIPFYLRALEISRQHAPASIRLWARNLAAAYIQLEDWDAAERANEEARRQPGPSSAADDAAIAIQTANIADGRLDLSRAERLYREILGTRPADRVLEWRVLSNLAVNLYKQGRVPEASSYFRAAEERVERARAGIRSGEDQVAFLGPWVRLHQQHVEALVEAGSVTAALEAAESFRARVLWQRLRRDRPSTPPSAADLVRLAAARRETLIAYLVAPVRSFAWVVTGDGVRLVTLPGQARITSAVQAYRSFIENSLRDPRTEARSPGRELHDMIVAPLGLPEAARMPRVVIAPDGPLFAVPFAALVAGSPPRFWIEDVEISLVPALRLLLGSGDPPSPSKARAVLALGAAEIDDPELPALPHAALELAMLGRRFPAEHLTVVSGREARPEAYLRADLSKTSVVHFASHAVANPSSPLDSSIVLARSPLGSRLAVRDILAVPLDAELVTLSACQSAGARIYGGEGMLGLAWGFLSAGARTVVAGLWDVGDRSTAALMDGFYAELARGSSPSAALRAGQLGLLRGASAWRRPFHWAAFSAYLGPGRARPPAASTGEVD
jgi:CHAT domain-containing protein